MAKSKAKRNELLSDYFMLDMMSKQLVIHQNNIRWVGRRMIKKSKTDLSGGIIESLNTVVMHMEKAQKELEMAKKELKSI